MKRKRPPGDARDIPPRHTEIGQFAIAELIELAKALVVPAPLLEHANQMSQEHGR
jgi:hypothetical protein